MLEGQKYCRMLKGEHSVILLTFIKLQFVIKIFVLSIFESPLKKGFPVSVLFNASHIYFVLTMWQIDMCRLRRPLTLETPNNVKSAA